MIAETRKLTPLGGALIDNVPQGKLIMKFRIPDFDRLVGVKRPGTTLPYVW